MVPVGTRLNGDVSRDGWRPVNARPGTRDRRWSDAMMWDEAMRERDESGGSSGFAHEEAGVTPVRSDTTNDSRYMDGADEEEYPLEEGMYLFEVSSKDDEGVSELFEHLVSNIIERREDIQREKILRERNSVVLSSAAFPKWDTPSSASEAGRLSISQNPVKGNGWSCCST